MSGGHLIVLDHAGRDSKRFSLPDGLATLGSDHSCDIRILLPTVSPHHATVVVRANQTLVRAVCGETRVNGAAVSVAALRHGDVLALGGRRLRWEYRDAAANRPLEPEPALVVRELRSAGRRASAGAAGAGAGARRERHLQLAAELASRASMPAGAGALGKQVAIVQPQRRDAGQQRDPTPRSPRAPAPRRATPLRAAVLRRTLPPAAGSAAKPRVTKIQAPSVMDHTKQAAFMLMMRHTPKGEAPAARRGAQRASLPLRRRAPPPPPPPRGRSLPARLAGPGGRQPSLRRATGRRSAATVIEITGSTIRSSDETERSPLTSPPPRSPKKSALKDPKSNSRKIESIKFDLSNLEDGSRRESGAAPAGDSEEEAEAEALHYPDSPPSPARSRASPRAAAPRPRRTLETYSIVDLVSIESSVSEPTVYDSADSSVVSFGTPRPGGGRRTRSGGGRRTRSGAAPALLASSTPYAGRAASARPSPGPGGGRPPAPKALATPENAPGVPAPAPGGRAPRPSKSRSRLNESDLLRSAAEDASPLSSRRAGRGDDVADDTFVDSGETTPVLSIRSLLDSSREAPSRERRAVRSEPRGGERGRRPVRRTLLRLGGDAPGEGGGRRATPPRAPRPSPSPSPVKNKHSTAKKPVSKRPLLDHFERSDVVKTLFHSPVKRKLSRSMVEFSKTLTEDDEAPRKRARNTIAGPAPPARPAPASPPRTPARSPGAGARGGKRLFSPRAPSPPAPARRSLRTPRPAGGPGGGGRAAAASRRSEKISAPSPRNDYRNVSVQKKARAPKNDLSDFRGVRELFRERRSPRDDLTDVGGVKRAFGRAPADDLTDVSGVGRLFEAPSPADAFDRLLAAPRSASFRRSPAKRDYTRAARSLQAPLEQLSDSAARALAAELKRRGPPSEVFPAHRLPIKKRSLVVAGAGAGAGGEAPPLPPLPPLPLKKRALTHSTPLKGRGQGRGRGRGASTARVSPIPPPAPDAITMNEVSDIKSMEDKPKIEKRKRETAVKPSPRKTRGRGKVLAPAPDPAPASDTPPRRATRRAAADSTTARSTKRRRGSLVLIKKPIVPSSKPVSPKLTRRGRGAAEPAPPTLATDPEPDPARRPTRTRRPPAGKPATPKTTRAKVSKTIALVASPPPEPQARRTRRKAAPPPPVEAPRTGRARRHDTTEPKSEAPEPANPPIEERPKPKRGRRAGGREAGAPGVRADVAEPRTRSRRGEKAAQPEPAPPAGAGAGGGRKRKAAVEAPSPPKARAVGAGGRPARGARRGAAAAGEAAPVEARPERGRRAKVVVESESEPQARAGRAARRGAAGAASPAKARAGRSRRR